MTLIVTFNLKENTIWAGYMVDRHPFPPQSEGFFLASEISIEPGMVCGRINFPQMARFEFKGSLSQLKRGLINAGGSSAALQIPGLTWWINS